MSQLRQLLSRLAPGPQAVFIVAMNDVDVQRHFFERVAASDHHCYPGGLFDQSVRAAELAHAQTYLNGRDRDLATLGALLFDLGKASDSSLAPDAPRLAQGIRPHPMTRPRLERALSAVQAIDPSLPKELRNLFAAPQAAVITAATVRLAAMMHEAIRLSWEEGNLHG